MARIKQLESAAIVIGGGAIGLHLAILLCRLTGGGSKPVVLMHQTHPTNISPARWYTLTPASVQWLTDNGTMPDTCHSFDQMQVEDLIAGAGFDYHAASFGTARLGCTVAACDLHNHLLQQINDCQGLHQTSACTGIQRHQQQWLCKDSDGSAYLAPLVFVANGKASDLYQGIGAGRSWTNGDWGIISNLQGSSRMHRTARQWFTHQGIIALLPAGDDQYSLVWSSRRARQLIELDDTSFIAALQSATAGAAMIKSVITAPTAFPLHTHCATRLVHQGIARIGNSACTIHPLAGQGLNLGLWQLARLTGWIQQQGVTTRALYNWQAEALPVNYGWWMLMRQLADTFRTTNPLIVLARNQLLRRVFTTDLAAGVVTSLAMYGVPGIVADAPKSKHTPKTGDSG